MEIDQNSHFNYSHDSSDQVTHQLSKLDNLLSEAILSSWVDGILILTEQGQVVHSNDAGRQICDRLHCGQKMNSHGVHQEVWEACQILMRRYNRESDQKIVIESEMKIDEQKNFRIRVRRVELNNCSQPYLLVMLEDQYQSIQNLAIAEVDRYQLSPREAEVWVLRRIGYSLKRISKELYISINTVKKHLKTIREKQQEILTQEDLHSYGLLS